MNMDKYVCHKPSAWNRRAVSLAVPGAVLLGLMLVAPNVPLVIFAGILLAVLISASGSWIARRLGCSRRVGIGLFMVVLNLALAGVFTAFVPAILEQVNAFVEQVPTAIEALRKGVEDIPWLDRLLTGATPSTLFSDESREMTTGAVRSTFGAFGNAVIVLFIGLFGALDPDLYRRGVLGLVTTSLRPRACEVMDKVGDTMRSWLIAQLIAMALVGVLTGLGMWMIGVPLPLLLGLIAGMLAFIPNLGPVIAAVPAMLLAVPLGGQAVVFVVLVFVVVQALESYAVTPFLQQRTVSLPPALVIGVQLLMGTLFGFIGLVLATPLAAVAMTLINAIYVEDYLSHDKRRD
ncbi:AI-2E family transporter [Roseovarius nitratireducens]|uniref:AI-2E family transporter n=1 Tax=Roseovarius nitratireducens TaxID=2044597 RepID=UPI001F0C04CD|nr:AI-2E family transporter [Roseovarius nitratireducens]